MLNNGLRSAFAERNFRLYTVGSVISWLTFFCQFMAVNWLAWEQTHSTGWLGAIAFLDVLPYFLFGPFGNVLADRFDRFLILVITQSVALCHALVLGLAAASGLLGIELLAGLTFLHGSIHAFGVPAQFGLLPRAVSAANLTTAIAIGSAYRMLAMFAGPALAGVMLARLPVSAAFFANVAGYGVYVGVLLLMRLPPTAPAPSSGRTMFGEFLTGLVYAARHRGIAPVMLLGLFGDAMSKAVMRLLPAFSDRVFHAGSNGMAALTGAVGLGATIAAVWIAQRGVRGGVFRITLAGFGTAILAAGVFVLSSALWLSLVAALLFGAGSESALTGATVLIQGNVDDALRARVMGSRFLLSQTAGGLTLLVLGPLVDRFGFAPPMLGFLVLASAAGLWLLRRATVISGAFAGG